MTQTAKHTPLPWVCNDECLIFGQVSSDDEPEAPFVADCARECATGQYTEQEQANTELIVRAVNNHADLLRELRGARLMLHAWLGSRPAEYGPHPELERTIRDIEAAIAKATA